MAILTWIAWVLRRTVTPIRHTAWVICLTLLFSFAQGAAAPTTPSAEYQLKAVFLFNFAQFVEWPARAFSEPTAPLIIAVLGDNPFGTYLDDLLKDEKIGGRPLLVRHYKRVEELATCHMVFICRSEARELDKIIAHLKSGSILTVSDADTFTRQGGMVRFATENGKIRLRINVEAAKASDLIISSKILRPGTIVPSGKD
jgi:hypothetical protein